MMMEDIKDKEEEEEESTQIKVVEVEATATVGGGGGGGGTGSDLSNVMMMLMDSYTPVHQSSHHPLLNDAILCNLIEVSDASQLAQLRTVCKTWEERSRSRFRRIATVTHDAKADYSGEQVVSKVVAPAEAGRWPSPAMECNTDGVEKYDLSSTTPFHKFFLANWDIKGATMEQSVWNQVGSCMTTLTLSNCTFYENGVALGRLLFGKTPNLEYLTLDNVALKYSGFRGPRGRQIFESPKLSELDKFLLAQEGQQQRNLKAIKISGYESKFSMIFCLLGPKLGVIFPNLQRIHLSVTPRPPPLHSFLTLLELYEQSQFGADDYDTLSQLLIGAGRVREHDPTKFQITHLDILGLGLKYSNVQQFPAKVGVLLQERSFPLKSLSVDVGVVSVSNEAVLEGILKCHSSTLTKLELRRSQLKLNPVIRFPFGVTLSCLVELKLHGAFLTSIADLKHFPNLRTFECRPRQGEEQPLVTMDAKDNHLIANFRLPRLLVFKFIVFQPGAPANLRVLAQCMPSLEEIWMQINSDTFPALCSLWSKTLRKLNVSYWRNAVDDSVITGIKNINPRVVPLLTTSLSLLSRNIRKPNVTNLTHLQEFRMHPNPPTTATAPPNRPRDSPFRKPEPSRLTRLSFEEGFYCLPNLKKLRVAMNESIIEKQVKALEDKGVDVMVYPAEKCECDEMCSSSSWIPSFPTEDPLLNAKKFPYLPFR